MQVNKKKRRSPEEDFPTRAAVGRSVQRRRKGTDYQECQPGQSYSIRVFTSSGDTPENRQKDQHPTERSAHLLCRPESHRF